MANFASKENGMSERVPIPIDQVRDFVIACHAKRDVVSEMLDDEPGLARASIDWGEGDWENGLEAAGHMGNLEIAELLLSHGVSRTVFSAAMMGESALVKQLLKTDPSAVSTPGVHTISLVYHVALSGDVGIAECVDAAGDSPGKDDALHAAVRFGHTEMAAWLLANGVEDPTKLNFQKKTPLEVATEAGYDRIVSLLKELRAAR